MVKNAVEIQDNTVTQDYYICWICHEMAIQDVTNLHLKGLDFVAHRQYSLYLYFPLVYMTRRF